MNAPIRVLGRPWTSIGDPTQVEIIAATPRRSPPNIGSTVVVDEARYRVVSLRPVSRPPVGFSLDPAEACVELLLAREDGQPALA
jgi:hypothetical protein